MRAFLLSPFTFHLSPFKRQAKVFSLASLLLVAALYALVILLSFDEWNTAKGWHSGQGVRCERLFSEAKEEIAAIDKGRCDLNGNIATQAACKDADKTRRSELVETMRRSGCPFKSATKDDFSRMEAVLSVVGREERGKSATKYDFSRMEEVLGAPESTQPPASGFDNRQDERLRKWAEEDAMGADDLVLNLPHPPGPLPIYVLESLKGIPPPFFPVAFLSITAALILLGDFTKRVLTDSHSGWKRLTLVASVLSAAAVTGWWIHEGENGGETMLAAMVAFCLVGATIVYGRAVFRWVTEGFLNEERKTAAPPPTTARESAPEHSSGRDEEGAIPPKTEVMQPDDQMPLTITMRQHCASCARETEHDAKGHCGVCGRNAAASEANIKSKSRKIRHWNMPHWVWWIGGIGLVALNFAHNSDKAIQTLISTLVQGVGLLIIYGIYLLFSNKK